MRGNEIDLASIPERALRVLARPTAFFRDMPRTGGFLRPLVSVAVMGIVNGLLVAVLSGFVSCMNLVAFVRGLYLVAAASVGVQGLPAKSAWIVFGFFAFIGVMLSFSAQYAVRSMGSYPADLERMREPAHGPAVWPG